MASWKAAHGPSLGGAAAIVNRLANEVKCHARRSRGPPPWGKENEKGPTHRRLAGGAGCGSKEGQAETTAPSVGACRKTPRAVGPLGFSWIESGDTYSRTFGTTIGL